MALKLRPKGVEVMRTVRGSKKLPGGGEQWIKKERQMYVTESRSRRPKAPAIVDPAEFIRNMLRKGKSPRRVSRKRTRRPINADAINQYSNLTEVSMFECPYCENKVELEEQELFEDAEGQFIVCPHCDEDIAVQESPMDEAADQLISQLSEMNEAEIDAFVDSLTEEQREYVSMVIGALEEQVENDTPEKLTEDIISSIASGKVTAEEIADQLAGK